MDWVNKGDCQFGSFAVYDNVIEITFDVTVSKGKFSKIFEGIGGRKYLVTYINNFYRHNHTRFKVSAQITMPFE